MNSKLICKVNVIQKHGNVHHNTGRVSHMVENKTSGLAPCILLELMLPNLLSVICEGCHFSHMWKTLTETVKGRTDNTLATRYQRGNQKLLREAEQTTQWPKDIKGVIRNC